MNRNKDDSSSLAYSYELQHNKLVVIGLGNRYRRDDGLGPFLIDILTKKNLPAQVQLTCTQGLSLLELWDQTDLCILIDASQSGQSPGTIYRFDGFPYLTSQYFYNNNIHSFGLAEAIMLGKALNQLPRNLITYGVEGKSFELGYGLSPEVEEVAEGLAEKIGQDIAGYVKIPE